MKATEVLMSEHRVIEHVITSLENAANRMERGQPVRPAFFLEASAFITGFADGCHHRKEEGVLFPALIDNGLPAQGGPVAMMLAEHDQGRAYNRDMRQAAQRLEQGDASARQLVIKNALDYADLLRGHISKEDCILFPMADKVIPLEQQEKLLDDFERVEHEETGEGIHEKYLALAEKLEKEIK
jgi:hemerythrin-like domain-containing protein